MESVHQRTRSAPSPLVGEGWGGNGAYGNASASIAPPPPLTPPHKGKGNAPSARPRCRSSTDEHARLRCVSCFTLGPADALYGWRRHRAIGDGGRSPTARPSWAFPPSTGPRWLPPAGPFSICEWFRVAASDLPKRSAPAAAGARRSKWWIRASVAKTRGVGHLFPMGQAFRDDLGRLQRRLAQGRILDDLALHARGLALQRVAQRLQLSDEFVDFLHRSPCYPLQELVDVVGNQLAIALRLAPNAHN